MGQLWGGSATVCPCGMTGRFTAPTRYITSDCYTREHRRHRALTGFENAEASIEATNRSLGITTAFLPATTRPVPHVVEGEHPGLAAVRVAHAGFVSLGFKGSEEPTDP